MDAGLGKMKQIISLPRLPLSSDKERNPVGPSPRRKPAIIQPSGLPPIAAPPSSSTIMKGKLNDEEPPDPVGRSKHDSDLRISSSLNKSQTACWIRTCFYTYPK